MAMKWIGKLAGGVLGGLVLGPLGALIGVLVGHQYDAEEPLFQPQPAEDLAAIGELFFRATFRVMGCLAKADGRVSELEIAAARGVMGELRLNSAQVQEAIACFSAGKHPDFNLDAELAALAHACRGRPDLTRVFLELQVRAALAGNDLQGPVRPLLHRIAQALAVSPFEFAHIEAVLRIQRDAYRAGMGRNAAGAPAPRADLEEAYRVLEVSASASDAEVEKAYRRQVSRHHPDKLKAHGLPDSMMAHAKQRTQQIIEAWELVRERRGLR